MNPGPAYPFPPGFIWGTATAAAQIEGSAQADGKGESIWDRFAAEPGRVLHGDTPAVACDHYRRYPADIAIMQAMGVKHYRLSLAWTRLQPTGRGDLNPAGVAHYRRLFDALHAAGITPWVTLYHWDLPQALQDEGGWLHRATATAFGDYAARVVGAFHAQVQHWFTMNELLIFIGLGYETGLHAPGWKKSLAEVRQAYHHALLGHGLAVQAVRDHGGTGAQVGLVLNPHCTVPVIETAEHIRAARAAFVTANEPLFAPLFRGAYPASFAEDGIGRPVADPADAAIIAAPTDFFGLNIYTATFVRADATGQPDAVPYPPQYPVADCAWLRPAPQNLYWAGKYAREEFGTPPLLITENGAAFADQPNAQGEVLDLDRREYLRNQLLSLQRAVNEGIDYRGYFLWSLLDNFEWADGYSKRFGLVRVDYATQQRTPKLSAAWYAEVMRQNAVV